MKDFLQFILKDSESVKILKFLVVMLTFVVLEVIYGYLCGSLTLLGDAVHMLTDACALILGLVVNYFSKSDYKGNWRFPVGMSQLEPLVGLLNGVFLITVAVNLFREAWSKYNDLLINDGKPSENGQYDDQMVFVAIGGLIVNLIGLFFFN